eukprot:1117640-Pelagomonas_calceolata.AAC.1
MRVVQLAQLMGLGGCHDHFTASGLHHACKDTVSERDAEIQAMSLRGCHDYCAASGFGKLYQACKTRQGKGRKEKQAKRGKGG